MIPRVADPALARANETGKETFGLGMFRCEVAEIVQLFDHKYQARPAFQVPATACQVPNLTATKIAGKQRGKVGQGRAIRIGYVLLSLSTCLHFVC